MKYEKYLLFSFILLISIASASAVLTDGLKVSYSMDSSNGIIALDDLNTYNAQTNGSWTTGRINNGIRTNQTTLTNYSNSNFTIGASQSQSYVGWFKADTIGNTGLSSLFSRRASNINSVSYSLYFNSTSLILQRAREGISGDDVFAPITGGINTNTWYMYAITYNGSNQNLTIYFNGTNIMSANRSGNGNINRNLSLSIGNDNGGTFFNGTSDIFLLYNRTLSPLEVNQLWNGGAGIEPLNINPISFISPTPDSGTSITPFNFSVRTNITNTSSLNYSIIRIYDSTNSLLSFNTSTTEYGTLDYTSTTPKTLYFNASAYLNNGSIYNTETRTVYLRDGTLTVTATNLTGGSVAGFNLTVTDLNRGTSEFYNSGTVNTIIPSNLSVTIQHPNYAYASKNKTISSSSESLSFVLYPTNSVNVSLFDEVTTIPISTNVTLSLRSDSILYNYSFNGNSRLISGVQSGEYTLTITATNYSSRNYLLSISEGSTQSLNAYLLSNADSQSMGFYVKSITDNVLSNSSFAIFKLINSTYVSISHDKTDILGFVVFNLKDGGNYRFLISANGYTTKQFDFTPYFANQPYTFKLNPASGITFTNIYDDISYYYSPTSANLNRSIYTFALYSASVSGSITGTTMSCYNTTQTSNVPSGAFLSFNLNTSNVGSRFNCTFTIASSLSSEPITWIQYYTVYTPIENSVATAGEEVRDDVNNIGWTTVLAYILIVFSIIIARKELDSDPRGIAIIVILEIIAFSVLGWIDPIMGGVVGTIALFLLFMA